MSAGMAVDTISEALVRAGENGPWGKLFVMLRSHIVPLAE
jgi:hypothetical protein